MATTSDRDAAGACCARCGDPADPHADRSRDRCRRAPDRRPLPTTLRLLLPAGYEPRPTAAADLEQCLDQAVDAVVLGSAEWSE